MGRGWDGEFESRVNCERHYAPPYYRGPGWMDQWWFGLMQLERKQGMVGVVHCVSRMDDTVWVRCTVQCSAGLS